MQWQVPTPKTRFSAVGMDIFAGGFSVGVSEYFNIRAHLEEGTFGVDTFKANFPKVPVHIGYDSWPSFKGVDLLYSNPPCSPWSSVGRSMRRGHESWRTDPNAAFGKRAVEYALRMQPKVFAFESVPPLERSEFMRDVARMWLDAGYAFTLVREDAKFFSLPQQRRRLFMVAHKVEIPWSPHVEVVTAETMATAGEALETVAEPGTIEAMSYGHDELLKDLAPGQGLRTLWEERNSWYREKEGTKGGVPGRPVLMAHRVRPDAPSLTVVGQNAYVHPFENRTLGHLETARLCGYPDGYQWEPSAGYLLAQVAKSVTPPAGEFLAYNVAAALAANVPVEPQAKRVTMWAPSPRVVDFRFQNTTETLNVEETPVTISIPDSQFTQTSFLPESPKVTTGRALITGVTPLHVNSSHRKTEYVSLPHALRAALELAGWAVDWTYPRAGWEALERGEPYDVHFIGICNFESLSADQVYDMAYLYERARDEGRRIVFYTDDWQVHTCIKTLVRWRGGHRKIHNPTSPLREKFRLASPDEHRPLGRMIEELEDSANWPPLVIQLLDAADKGKLFAGHDRWPTVPVETWNPLPFFPTFADLAVDPEEKVQQWTYAALYDHSGWLETLDNEWPVKVAGSKNARISEEDVARLVASSWGSLSPPYKPVTDSGWVRPRWWFAAQLGTVLHGDPKELGQWAPSYDLPLVNIERMDTQELTQLAAQQKSELLALCPSRASGVVRAVELAMGRTLTDTERDEVRACVEATDEGAPLRLPSHREAPSQIVTPVNTPRAVAQPRKTVPSGSERVPRTRFGPGVATEYRDLAITNADTVLDIGAHRGEFLRFVRSVAPSASITCFEPDLDNELALMQIPDAWAAATSFARFAVVAATDERSEVPLYLCGGSDTSMHSLVAKRGRRPEMVSAMSIDQVYEISNWTVVKLAVEGYETVLLQADLPESVRQLAVKFHPSTDASRDEARASIKRIESQGFVCVRAPQLDRGSWPVVGVWAR